MLIKFEKIKNYNPIIQKAPENLATSGLKTMSEPKTCPISPENHKAYSLAFLGKDSITKRFEDQIKSINGNYYGKGLFEGEYINWNKVGWDNLKKEPIDWKKAKEPEIMAFWHALALAETKENMWVRKYNPTNVPNPLATYHTLASDSSKMSFAENLQELNKIAENKCLETPKLSWLDLPVINSKTGKLNFAFTVFDTETTGVNTDPRVGPPDKIVQIGGVKVDPGERLKTETVLNQFVNPEMPIPEGATEVHHISDEMVKNKPTIKKVLKDFNEKYLGNDPVVAYNAKFDIAMLNNSINEYNKISSKELEKRKLCLTLDPFILVQRIHPYLGAKKTLTEQHKFLFGKGIDGAHDALEDSKATINVLKYCCEYLNKNYKPEKDNPKKQLTVRDLLTFQLGGKVEGLNIKLNTSGCDSAKDFSRSYRLITVGVNNFDDGYAVSKPTKKYPNKKDVLSIVAPKIGEENTNILKEELLNKDYKLYGNFKDALILSGIQGYNGKSREEIVNTIIKDSVKQLNHEYINVWMKNTKLKEKEQGNDIPDIDIVRRIMTDDSNNSNLKNIQGRRLKDVLT